MLGGGAGVHLSTRMQYARLFYICSTGMSDGEKIIFEGEGDQEPLLKAGDVIIILDEKEHPHFRRRGDDLICNMTLQLVESLCGFQKVIRTLDDRELLLTTLPGKVCESLA